ncbi:MAG: esterase-like activity of phytase family protein, partial [Proteobacteria bacterium]
MGKLRAFSILTLLPISFAVISACQHSSKSEAPRDVNRIEVIEFRDLPGLEESDIQLGGFSGLTFDGNMSGRLTFKTHTDRGPNENPRPMEKKGAGKSMRRPFLLPEFQPRWVQFSFEPASKTLRLDNQILLTHNGKKMTGLPNKFEGEKWDEYPVDKNDKPLRLDLMGIDPEAIVRSTDGTYWMSEEYRPSLLHFSAEGKLLKRLVPEGSPAGTGEPLLPGRYLKRRLNGGFEGIAFREGTVYGFLQSSLTGEDGKTRILAVDSESGKTKADYLYEFEKAPEGWSAPNKIGDAAAL